MKGRYDFMTAVKTLGLSAAGYAAVLLLGVGLARLLDDGESFTGLGIIALTVVFLAPIGAVTGSFFGLRRYGAHNMLRPARYILAAGVVSLTAVTMSSAGSAAMAWTTIAVAVLLVLLSGYFTVATPPTVRPTQT